MRMLMVTVRVQVRYTVVGIRIVDARCPADSYRSMPCFVC